MSTFAVMQARIADELARADLTNQIKLAVNSAIAFYDDEPFWFLEEEDTFNTADGTVSYALPTDFREFVLVTATVSGGRFPIYQMPWDVFRSWNTTPTTSKGSPTDYAIYEDLFWPFPAPDGVYVITRSYRKTFAALSADADTNAWMTHGEELIRQRAKWDLYLNVIKDLNQATAMDAATQRAFTALCGKNIRRLGIGKLRATKF